MKKLTNKLNLKNNIELVENGNIKKNVGNEFKQLQILDKSLNIFNHLLNIFAS